MSPARLVADIGGTNARFALHDGGKFDCIEVLSCAQHETLADAMHTTCTRPPDAASRSTASPTPRSRSPTRSRTTTSR
ncbi:glucokinase [Massilia sp. Se16.2.3]|uniref:glucokinase n=1 Tax=Massilia sp. Se16.2.3 TaxID=2709303 RepID=UPI001E3021E7|nr:glucokinase [Massilia sp. Se16.2.3]